MPHSFVAKADAARSTCTSGSYYGDQLPLAPTIQLKKLKQEEIAGEAWIVDVARTLPFCVRQVGKSALSGVDSLRIRSAILKVLGEHEKLKPVDASDVTARRNTHSSRRAPCIAGMAALDAGRKTDALDGVRARALGKCSSFDLQVVDPDQVRLV